VWDIKFSEFAYESSYVFSGNAPWLIFIIIFQTARQTPIYFNYNTHHSFGKVKKYGKK